MSDAQTMKNEAFAQSLKTSIHESDQYFYYLEFYHLRKHGKTMWVKRRREDIIFSARYARHQPSFEPSCYNFILEKYG